MSELYLLLGEGAAGIIACLVLLIQRNAARVRADNATMKADFYIRALAAEKLAHSDYAKRRALVTMDMQTEIDELRKERDALLATNPNAAGDLLDRVLSPAAGGGATPSASVPGSTPTTGTPNKAR